MLTTETCLVPGTRIDRYEIEQKLAVGGVFETYLARTTSPSSDQRQPLILKRLLPYHSGDHALAAQLLGRLRSILSAGPHKNLATIYEVGQCPNEHYYFTLEFVPGGTVAELAEAGRASCERLPRMSSIGIVESIAAGLHVLHGCVDERGQQGLILRTLSPDKVRVSEAGTIKLVPLSADQLMPDSDNSSRIGVILGDFHYLAPEVVLGLRPDSRSDIYSAGLILWELLSGRQARAPKPLIEFVRDITTVPLPDLRALDPACPAELSDIVMRAVAPNPADRFETANDFRAALAAFQDRV